MKDSDNMRLKSIMALIATTILWGSSFIMIKLLLGEMPPIAIATLRFLIASPLLLAVALLKNRGARPRGSFKAFLVLGLLGVALYQLLQNFGLKYTMTSEASILICTDPIFITLLSYFFLGERIGAVKVAGIMLAFLGISVIVLRSGPHFSSEPAALFGDFLALGAAASWALYSIYGKIRLRSNSAADVAAFSSLFGALLLLPVMLAFEGLVLPETATGWMLLVALAILPSGVAYLLWYIALEDVSAYNAGLSLFFIPLVSMLMAALLLGDRLDLIFGVGAAMVLGGVLVAIVVKR